MLKFRSVFFVSFILLFHTLYSQETATYVDSSEPYPAGKKSSIFYDSTGLVTEQNILSVSEFHPAGDKFPVFDVKQGNLWIKVAVRNESSDSILYFNLPYCNISKLSIFKAVDKK